MEAPSGDNRTSRIIAIEAPVTGVFFVDKLGGKVLIGQMHGHPESQDSNERVISGASPDKDVDSAITFSIPILAIDAMKKTNRPQAIHLVTPKGDIINNVGTTIGRGNRQTEPTVNLGETIMKCWGNR